MSRCPLAVLTVLKLSSNYLLIPTVLCTLVDIACGGILKARAGVLSSPSDPEHYPHGTTCRYEYVSKDDIVMGLLFNTEATSDLPLWAYSSTLFGET